ncbi:MAG: TIGR02452 family protein [bacterium]
MISRTALMEVFRDTQQKYRDDPDLRSATLKMQAETLLYLKDFEALDPREKSRMPDIEILEDTTFHCAKRLMDETDTDSGSRKARTAVLNFANAYHPGGGVTNGAMAQEECLCRSSNLYSALTLPYILRNYYKWNGRNTGDMGTDAVVWSPGVTVFKTDDPVPAEMERDQWFQVDVLTCAAPYYDKNKKHPVTPEKLREVFYHRIRNILEVAAAKDTDILVLGAFGCGAFNNPPALVADVCRELLLEKGYFRFFRKTAFAIKKNNSENTNLEAFREAFKNR